MRARWRSVYADRASSTAPTPEMLLSSCVKALTQHWPQTVRDGSNRVLLRHSSRSPHQVQRLDVTWPELHDFQIPDWC